MRNRTQRTIDDAATVDLSWVESVPERLVVIILVAGETLNFLDLQRATQRSVLIS